MKKFMRGGEKVTELDLELEHIFSGFEGSETITENLITELKGRGFPEIDLRALQRQGFKYFRGSDSFFMPYE